MLARLGPALLLAVGLTASGAQAQQSPSADSLVALFIQRGTLSPWLPHKLFEGCPRLQRWQQRGIDLLVASELSPERTKDLAHAWMIPLRGCHDARLEGWYFRQVNSLVRQDDPQGLLLSFWTALQHGDSPGIRDYLRNLMLDVTKPENYRSAAGVTLFVRFGPEERLREYLRAFETRRMPFEVDVGQTTALLEQNAERLLEEVGRRVRQEPALADQGAFRQIVETSDRYASAAARRRLGAALKDGLSRPGLSESQRYRLDAAVQFLLDAEN